MNKWHWWLVGCLCWAVAQVATAQDELVVFSGRSDKFIRPVVEQFTNKTGIKVILHAGKSTELLNKLRLEGKRSNADIYISNDAGNLQKGSEWQLFRSLPSEVLEKINPNYRAADDTWVGLSARARVLVVNTKAEDVDFVSSVFDLANPKLQGRLAITNSANESFIAGVSVYLALAGEERTKQWLAGLKHNVGNKVYAKHSHVVKDVAVGKKSVGLVNHYYIYRYLAEHPEANIRILLPDNDAQGIGVAWNVAGVAIVRDAPHAQQALELVKFLVSEQGQAIFAEVNQEYPTRPDVPAAAQVPDKKSFKVADVPMRVLGERRNETIDLIEQVGLP